tara:strand:+ start:1242 stop:1568 length:327 start_codon:yes stop_codon:yes gene_type:complete
MTYFVLYIAGIASIWWVYRVGWTEALKTILSVLIPSILIILFNAKAGRLLFKSPIIGLISLLPTAFFIYRGSKPLVFGINSWIDSKRNEFVDSHDDVVDAEVISKEKT